MASFGATYNYTDDRFTLSFGADTSKYFASSMVVGDFNSDGKLDVIIAFNLYPFEDKATPLLLLTGNGAGAFTDSTSAVFGASVPTVIAPRQIVVGDFNGDSRPDFFIADHGYDVSPYPGRTNVLVLSTGASGLSNASATLPTTPDFTHSAAIADIDGDGDLDILVGNIGGGQIGPYFLINDGHGNFTQSLGRLPSSIEQRFNDQKFTSSVFVDANGDGKPDLFLGTHGDGGADHSVILLNDGTGHFLQTYATVPSPAPASPGDVPAAAMDIVPVDINGDGRLDLIVDYEMNSYASGRLQILIKQADGSYVDETASRISDPTSSQWFQRAIVVDLNGDGFKDILMSNGTDQPVFLNDGTGHFLRMPIGFMPGNPGWLMQVGDFNGDGRTDIFASQSGGQFSVRLGKDLGLTQTGNDSANGLMGDNRSETFSGAGGDDVIVTGGGNDTVSGGTGNDTIAGVAGTNYLRGDDGNDSIVGGSGFDDINGNQGNDTCVSGGGDDWVVGGKDNDSLTGSDGQNLVYGNLGDDTCDGGAGNDIVRGGQGNDIVKGGAGDDFISGDKGDDTITGGAGADSFHTFGDAGIDRVLDFSRAEGDRVQLDPGTQYTVAQVGADTVISMTGGGQMILVGVQMSTLTGDWIFGA